ncbi:hypothetical protein FHG87_001815 [Trinorchestia longiramus]|nr:hypothetical protein FHG87_001815 [Trinorchestia longiramus]
MISRALGSGCLLVSLLLVATAVRTGNSDNQQLQEAQHQMTADVASPGMPDEQQNSYVILEGTTASGRRVERTKRPYAAGWVDGSDEGTSVSELAALISTDEVGRNSYSDYGGHGEVSYGGQGYATMAKYIDPFTVLAFGIFCAFLTYIYFYCIIKKNCIQFASCTANDATLPRRVGTSDLDSHKVKNEIELFSLVDRMLTAAQETWGEDGGNSTTVM